MFEIKRTIYVKTERKSSNNFLFIDNSYFKEERMLDIKSLAIN